MKEVNVDNGKIIFKNLKDFLHIEHIDYSVPQVDKDATVNINAPQISGYSFVSWINVATHNFVQNCYIDTPDNPNATIWFAQSTMDTNPSDVVTAYALYVKD